MINRTIALSLAIGTGLAAFIALAGLRGPAAAAPAHSKPTVATPSPAGAPAAPASPSFPTGSRIGLVPPPGMMPSKAFPGFVDPDQHAVILVATLPAAAYADIQKTMTPQALKKQGLRLEKQQAFDLSFGKGVLVVGTQSAPSDKTLYRKWLLAAPAGNITALVTVQVPADNKAYQDAVIRPALATLAVRGDVPANELLSLLPFTVGNLAGFRIANVIPGRAMLLVDAPTYPHMVATQGLLPEFEIDGRLIIAAVPGGPSAGQARTDFARFAFGTIGGIKDVQLTMSEPVRLDDQEGFETVAHAKDATTGADLMVVQWLRFGVSEFLQVVGISRAPIWERELSRLRTLRDSIVLK
jgi:hypothetical protein